MGYVAQSLIIRLLDCPWMISHDNGSVLSTNCIIAERFLIIFCKNFYAVIEIHIYISINVNQLLKNQHR